MNALLFCTAFILQFVGHRVGDYLLQTNTQAIRKANDGLYRIRHCIIYSLAVSLMLLFYFDWTLVIIVYLLTLLEHMWVDSRTPVLGWKNFLEKKIAKSNDFKIEDLPFFVTIEIDQSIHMLRIFIISLLIGYGVL